MKLPVKFLLIVLFSISFISATKKEEQTKNNELLRPQFHYSPESFWMGKLTGMVYLDNEYHLFYQYNPENLSRSNQYWGHAISKDLLHWEYMPVALAPNKENEENFSIDQGCAIVDFNNASGLKNGDNDPIILFYTNEKLGQCISYSNDKGRSWKTYEANPIIPINEKDFAYKPKVYWHKESNKYLMLINRIPDENINSRGLSIFTSTNLINWEYQSHIKGDFDNPDLVELSVDRRPNDTKWVFIDSDGSYTLGEFDGKDFIIEEERIKSDYGKSYFSPVTCKNLPPSSNKTIQLGWLRGCELPDMPFNGMLTFPVELMLENTTEGIRLTRKPIANIKQLHDKQYNWIEKNIIPGINKNLTNRVKADCLHIVANVDVKTSDLFGFVLRSDKKDAGVDISFDCKKNILSCLGQQAKVTPINGKMHYEILLDRSSVEVFINGGKTVFSSCFTPEEDALNVILYTSGGELFVENMDIYLLNSIWQAEDN